LIFCDFSVCWFYFFTISSRRKKKRHTQNVFNNISCSGVSFFYCCTK